jgi:hypothetical protein
MELIRVSVGVLDVIVRPGVSEGAHEGQVSSIGHHHFTYVDSWPVNKNIVLCIDTLPVCSIDLLSAIEGRHFAYCHAPCAQHWVWLATPKGQATCIVNFIFLVLRTRPGTPYGMKVNWVEVSAEFTRVNTGQQGIKGTGSSLKKEWYSCWDWYLYFLVLPLSFSFWCFDHSWQMGHGDTLLAIRLLLPFGGHLKRFI